MGFLFGAVLSILPQAAALPVLHYALRVTALNELRCSLGALRTKRALHAHRRQTTDRHTVMLIMTRPCLATVHNSNSCTRVVAFI